MLLFFAYVTKEKEHQNTQRSALYSGATSPRASQLASCFDALSFSCYMLMTLRSCNILRQVSVSVIQLIKLNDVSFIKGVFTQSELTKG
jgi:hypothetical protein